MIIQQQLEQAMQALAPELLSVVNESHQHAHFVPGKESHFKLTIVSPLFEGKRLVQRHQQVYQLAGDLLSPSKIHALAIHAYTPQEWQGSSPDSPLCAGQRKETHI